MPLQNRREVIRPILFKRAPLSLEEASALRDEGHNVVVYDGADFRHSQSDCAQCATMADGLMVYLVNHETDPELAQYLTGSIQRILVGLRRAVARLRSRARLAARSEG